MAHSATKIAQKCKDVLARYYRPRFAGLLLYGSVARRRPSPDSDLDLLILLNRPFDFFDELRRIVDLLYPIQLESDRHISAKPVAVDDFEQGTLQLHRNARREGRVA